MHVYFLYRFVLCKFVICKLIWIRCIKPTMYLSLYRYFWKIGNAKLLQIIFQIPRINFGIRGEDNNVFSIVLIFIYFILISIDFFFWIQKVLDWGSRFEQFIIHTTFGCLHSNLANFSNVGLARNILKHFRTHFFIIWQI